MYSNIMNKIDFNFNEKEKQFLITIIGEKEFNKRLHNKDISLLILYNTHKIKMSYDIIYSC